MAENDAKQASEKGGETLVGNAPDENASKGVKALIDRALMAYERLPMLEIIFDRLTRLLSTSLRNLTTENVDVEIKSIFSLRYGDFIQSVQMPALVSIFKVIEWENYGLIVPNSSFVFAMVDLLFGGRKQNPANLTTRPYTIIEQSVITQVSNIVLNDLATAFEPISPANFHLDTVENNPRFVTICRPGDAAILVDLNVTIDERSGRIEILIPYETLEPIRAQLSQVYMGDKFGKDPDWEEYIEKEMYNTSLTLEAVLGEKEFPLQEILRWQVGDTIVFPLKPDDEISLRCANVDMVSGVMGAMDEKIAIKVVNTAAKKKIEEVI